MWTIILFHFFIVHNGHTACLCFRREGRTEVQRKHTMIRKDTSLGRRKGKINVLLKPTGLTSVEMFSFKALYGVRIILFSPDETSTCYASPHPSLLLSGTWTLNTYVYAWLTNFSVPNTAALPTLGCARWWPSIYTYGGHIGRATLFFWGRHMAGTNYTAPLV